MTPNKHRNQAIADARNGWLGLKLRDLRLEAGVGAVDLGGVIGIHEQTVYAYEQGRISIPWDNVLSICHQLEADPERLAKQYTRRFFGRRRSLLTRSREKTQS